MCFQLLNSLNWDQSELKSELNYINQNAFYDFYNFKKFEIFESESVSLKLFEQLLQKSVLILLKILKLLSESDKTDHETNYVAH